MCHKSFRRHNHVAYLTHYYTSDTTDLAIDRANCYIKFQVIHLPLKVKQASVYGGKTTKTLSNKKQRLLAHSLNYCLESTK
jgi:hypothetical protein